MDLSAKLTPSELANVADAAMRLGLRTSAAELIEAAYRVLGGEEATDVELTLSEVRSVAAAASYRACLSERQREFLHLVLGIIPSAGTSSAVDARYASLSRHVSDAERHVASLTVLVGCLERNRSFTAWKLGESLLATMTETMMLVRARRDRTGRAVFPLGCADDRPAPVPARLTWQCDSDKKGAASSSRSHNGPNAL